MYAQKRKNHLSPVPPVTEEQAQRQLAVAIGAERFQHRDPAEHLSEQFQQRFSRRGMKAAEALQADDRDSDGQKMPDEASMEDAIELGSEENNQRLQKFSEIAFQRGTLSAGILRGEGQMMLFSCLKRTIGQSGPKHWQERKLFDRSAKKYCIGDNKPAYLQANRGFSASAVNLVVDTLKGERELLEELKKAAESGGAGAETLLRQYPFLSDRAEQTLLQQYRSRSTELAEVPQKRILMEAAQKTEAVIQRKAQLREQFITHLRDIIEQARATEAAYQDEEFRLAAFAWTAESEEQDGAAESETEQSAAQEYAADTNAEPPSGGEPTDAESGVVHEPESGGADAGTAVGVAAIGGESGGFVPL